MTVGQVIAKLGVDPKEYEKGLKKAEAQADKAGSRIGSIFKNAFSVTVGMGMFEALKKGLKSTVGTAISFNSMLQTAQIGFATMLGSAEKAQKFLDDMADFAARTPFEYPELLEASKRMLAYGFAAEEVLPTLRAVGDASAALGSGSVGIDRITLALGQIRAKGKLSAEEMRQLTEAGVPAWHILAEAMGTTVPALQDMVSKGLVPGAKAVEMLTKGMTKRFGGMMASMEDTWQGVTSSIKDVWRMTVGMLTENLFKGVNQWLIKVRDFAKQFYDALKKGGLQYAIRETFGEDVAKEIAVFQDAINTIWGAIKSFTGFILNNWPKIAPIIWGIVIATIAYKLATWGLFVAQKAALIIEGLTKAWRIAAGVLDMLRAGASLATVAQWGLNAAMAANPVGLLTIAIGGLIVAGIALWRNWDKVSRFFVDAWGYMKIGVYYAAYGIVAAIRWALGWIPTINKTMSQSMKTLASWIEREKAIIESRKASMQDVQEGQEDVGESTEDLTGETKNQTKAMEELNKELANNIQSFDEVHQLQEDMASDIGDFDFTNLGLDSLEIDIEEPDFEGFWDNLYRDTEDNVRKLRDKIVDTWNLLGPENMLKPPTPPTIPPPDVAPVTTALETVNSKLVETGANVEGWAIGVKQDIEYMATAVNPPLTDVASNVQTTTSTWANNSKSLVQEWVDSTIQKINNWAINTKLAVNSWAVNTKQTLSTWVIDTYLNLANWKLAVDNLFTRFFTETPVKLTNWAVNTGTIITGWAKNAIAETQKWTINTKSLVENLCAGIERQFIDLKETAEPIISELLTNVETNVREWATNIMRNVEEMKLIAERNIIMLSATVQSVIAEWVVSTSISIATWVTKTTENIANWATNAISNVYKFASDAYDILYNWGQNSLLAINGFLETSATNVTSWANSTLRTISTWASETYEKIKDLTSSVGHSISNSVSFASQQVKNGFKATGEWIKRNKDWLIPVGAVAGLAVGGIAAVAGAPILAGAAATAGIATLIAPQLKHLEELSKKTEEVPQLAIGTNYVPQDMFAYLHEGEAVVPKKYNPAADGGITAETIEQAVYRAFINALRIMQASAKQDDKELVLKIDNTVLARMQLPAIIREGQRQGLNLVVQPQGV